MRTIEEIAADLANAKAAENKAKEERIAFEEELVAQVQTREKGSVTVPAGILKVTVTTGYNYKADIAAVKEQFPELIKVKAELDDKAYEAMREHDPDRFQKAARLVTVTPKKPTVTLKV